MSNPEIKTISNRFVVLIVAGILLITGIYLYSLYESTKEENKERITFLEESEHVDSSAYSQFNPNDLSKNEWIKLGFTEKQAETILKYKNLLGGSFSSKEQLKKCYVISEEKYNAMAPFIMLPEKSKKSSTPNYYSSPNKKYVYEKKSINVKQRFNPDLYSQKDWENLGFSDRQAAAIVKYKSYLGGSFISKEVFKDCFVISEQNYNKLAPYLILPDKVSKKNGPEKFIKENSTIVLEKFDPNILDKEGWESLGFSEKQAQVIINYRDKILKGSFKNLEEIKKCYVISDEKFLELQPYIVLNPSNYSLVTNSDIKQKSNTNFSDVDLNTITYDQLIEFGFSRKASSSFVGYRDKLGGFVNKNQVFETYNIDRDLAEELVKTVSIDKSSVQKYSLIEAPESWLKTHPYFRYSADKIIYHRISNDNEKKIWKKMNIKPEYEAKMRMYLVDND